MIDTETGTPCTGLRQSAPDAPQELKGGVATGPLISPAFPQLSFALFISTYSALFLILLYFFYYYLSACLYSNERKKEGRVWIWVGLEVGRRRGSGRGGAKGSKV